MRVVCQERCNICGRNEQFVVDDFVTLLREAICSNCGSSIRVSDIVGVIKNEIYIFRDKQIQYKENKAPVILNLASQGKVHELYKHMTGYHCGEYFDGVASGDYLNGVMCVDLQNIPFEDHYFDFVITEDVLEHVWDISKVLQEINRVLKVGGKHIFTIPVHENIVTMSRKNNPLDVFHGDPLRSEGAKVFTDFGRDTVSFVDRFGMKTEMYKLHTFHNVEEISFIDDEADTYKKNWKNMLGVFRYNSIVLLSEKVVDFQILKNKINTNKMNCMLHFTGERFVPGMSNRYMLAEHMQRYRSVLKLVRGKKVLDAACGAGYGSALLASEAESVIGIDISDEAIEYAKNCYESVKNAIYMKASVEKLPFADNSFDVVISFETIEHVDEKIQNSFLKEIERCLNNNGILIMSSPDKKTYSDLIGFNNEFHVREFYFDEFDKFLHREFKFVEHYLQGECNLSGEMIHPVNGHCNELEILNDIYCDRNKDHYIVSICSNRKINMYEKITSWFNYVYMPIVYKFVNGCYNDENIINLSSLIQDNNMYKVRFDFTEEDIEGRIRFSPLENMCCEMELISINTDVTNYSVLPVNAIKYKGSKYTFITISPTIELTGDFSSASYLEIQYFLRILDAREISILAQEKYAVLQEKCTVLLKRLDDSCKENILIKSTKGYRLLEKLRKLVDILCVVL